MIEDFSNPGVICFAADNKYEEDDRSAERVL